jgi:hypothetical protein
MMSMRWLQTQRGGDFVEVSDMTKNPKRCREVEVRLVIGVGVGNVGQVAFSSNCTGGGIYAALD